MNILLTILLYEAFRNRIIWLFNYLVKLGSK
jgi:hypothetical protein